MPVSGFREASAKIRQMREDLSEKVRAATKEAAEKILLDMVADAPRKSGETIESLEIEYINGGLGARIGQVDPDKARRAFYARFYELGTKGGRVRYRKGGKQFYMNVPPILAQPFIQPALDKNQREVYAAIAQAAREALR